jgi:hypothetical protein
VLAAPRAFSKSTSQDEVVNIPIAESMVFSIVRMITLLEKQVCAVIGGWFSGLLLSYLGPVTVEHSGGRFVAHLITTTGHVRTWSIVRFDEFDEQLEHGPPNFGRLLDRPGCIQGALLLPMAPLDLTFELPLLSSGRARGCG